MLLMRVPRDCARHELIGMALAKCAHCRGTGLTLEKGQVCRCVYRNIFHACLERYYFCTMGTHYLTPVLLEHSGSCPRGRTSFGRKQEEYIADFWLVAKRALADSPLDWAVLRFHFLLGADWKLCTRRLSINRGNFFHAVYRVEERLGRAFYELKPYALFPLDQYFGGTERGARTTALLAQQRPRRGPLRPPLAQAA